MSQLLLLAIDLSESRQSNSTAPERVMCQGWSSEARRAAYPVETSHPEGGREHKEDGDGPGEGVSHLGLALHAGSQQAGQHLGKQHSLGADCPAECRIADW